MVTWSEACKGNNININDEKIANIIQPENLTVRYIRSNESFTEGIINIKITVEFTNTSYDQVSLGIGFEENLNCNNNVYYFSNSYIYCSAYPSVTKDYTSVHIQTPPKIQSGEEFNITLDLDKKWLTFAINDNIIYDGEFNSNGKPAYLVCGMFVGKLTID